VLSICPAIWNLSGWSETEIVRVGDSIILRPVRPTRSSFAQRENADPDFMAARKDERRFDL